MALLLIERYRVELPRNQCALSEAEQITLDILKRGPMLLSELEQRGITQETLNELIAQGLVVFLAPVELYRLAP